MICWIAGWPHCGSTLLRQILKDSFDLQSYSQYLESELESLFEGGEKFSEDWQQAIMLRHRYYLEHDQTFLIKTHELPLDNAPAFFVVRDGRDAVSSLSHFWKVPIDYCIGGFNFTFGNWSSFYYGWNPHFRESTCIIRYEDMVLHPQKVCDQISRFLGVKQERPYKDDFEEKSKQYPYLFKDRIGVWKDAMSEKNLEYFWRCHGKLMKDLAYE